MKNYTFIYKCRMCGDFPRGITTSDKELATLALSEVDADTISNVLPIQKTILHDCEYGCKGIADIQGFAEEESE